MDQDLTLLVERVESEPWGQLTPRAADVRRYADQHRHRQRLAVAAAAVAGVAAVLVGVVPNLGNQTAAAPLSTPDNNGSGVASPAPSPGIDAEFPFLDPALVAKLSTAAPTFPEVDPVKARTLMQSCTDRDKTTGSDPSSATWTIAAAVQLPPITRTASVRLDVSTGRVLENQDAQNPAPPAVFIAAHQRGTDQAVWCVVSEESDGPIAGEGGVQPLWFHDHYLPGYVVPTSVRLITNDQQVEAGYIAKGVARVSVSLRGVTYPSVVRDGFYFAVVPAPIDTRTKRAGRPAAVPTVITAYDADDNVLGTTTNTPDAQSDPTISHGCWTSPNGERIKPIAPRRLGSGEDCGTAEPWAGHAD